LAEFPFEWELLLKNALWEFVALELLSFGTLPFGMLSRDLIKALGEIRSSSSRGVPCDAASGYGTSIFLPFVKV